MDVAAVVYGHSGTSSTPAINVAYSNDFDIFYIYYIYPPLMHIASRELLSKNHQGNIYFLIHVPL